MKRRDLLLLTLLLSQTTPVWAMWESDDRQSGDFGVTQTRASNSRITIHQHTTEDALRLKALITESRAITERKLKEYSTVEPKVVVMGPSSSGKSTLINLLAGKKLFVEEIDSILQINTTDPVPGSEIGNGLTSQTSVPSLCSLPNNIVVCDCPGSDDTEGSEMDMANLIMIHTVLTSGPVKLFLTVPEEELAGNGSAFLRRINYLTKMLPCAQLKDGLSIVVTKQNEALTASPHKRLETMLKTSEVSGNSRKSNVLMTEDVKNLLTCLTEEENIAKRIPYFPAPVKTGEYDSEGVIANITNSIDALKPVHPEVKFVMPADSRLFVIDLARNLNTEIENTITNLVCPKILNLCETQTTAYAREGSMEGLKQNIESIRLALRFCENPLTEDMMRFACSFDHLFDQDQENVFKENVKTLVFLKSLEDVKLSPADWTRTLKPTLDKVHEFIDLLANKLFVKIVGSLNSVRETVMECCPIYPKPNNEDGVVAKLENKLEAIRESKAALQEATPENRINFIHPLRSFFVEEQTSRTEGLSHPITIESYINAIENSVGVIETLSTLHELQYPKGEWLPYLTSSSARIEEILVNTRLRGEQLAEANQRREALTNEIETIRAQKLAQEQATAQQIAAVTQEKQGLTQQLEEANQNATNQHHTDQNLIRETEERRVVLADEIVQKNNEIETIRAQKLAQEQEATQKLTALTQEKQGLTQQLAAVTQEKQGLTQQLAAANQSAANQHLTDQNLIREAEERRVALANQIVQKNNEIETIKAQKLAQEKEATQQIAKVNQEKQGLMQQLAVANQEKQRLTQQLAEAKQNAAKQHVADTNEIARKGEQIRKLEAQLETNTSVSAYQLAIVNKEKQNLTQQLTTANTNLTATSHKLSAYTINDNAISFPRNLYPGVRKEGNNYHVNALGTCEYKLKSNYIPLQNASIVQVFFQVELKKGGFYVGLLSADQSKFIIGKGYPIGTTSGLVQGELELPLGTTEKGVFLNFANNTPTKNISEYIIKKCSIRAFYKK